MKKAITFVALAGLASASNFSLKMLQDKQIQELAIGAIEAEIVRVKDYVATHPEAVLAVQAQLARYQLDQNAWKTDIKMVMEKIAQHPEILSQVLAAIKNIDITADGEITVKGMFHPGMMRSAKVLNFDDEELFAFATNKLSVKMLQDKQIQELIIGAIEAEIHHAKEYVAAHPEVVLGVQLQIARYQQDKDAWKKDVKFVMEQVAQHPEIVNQVLAAIKSIDITADGDITLSNNFQPRKFAPLAFEDEEFFAFEDNELFNIKMLQDKNMQELVIQSIESDIHKAKEYVAAHPEVIEGLKAQFTRYQNDKNAWKSDVKLAMEKIAQHPEIVSQILGALKNINIAADGEIKMAANFQPRKFAQLSFEDHDFFAFATNKLSVKMLQDQQIQEIIIGAIEAEIHHAKEYVAAHPEVVLGVQLQIARYQQDKNAWKNDIRFIMDQIAQHPEIVNQVLGAIKSINITADGEITLSNNFQPHKFAPLAFEDEEFFAFDDNELFQAKQVHAFKDLGFEDQTDNNLFSLGDLIKDGKKIKEDVKNHNVKDLIKDGSKIIKDAKEIKKFLA